VLPLLARDAVRRRPRGTRRAGGERRAAAGRAAVLLGPLPVPAVRGALAGRHPAAAGRGGAAARAPPPRVALVPERVRRPVRRQARPGDRARGLRPPVPGPVRERGPELRPAPGPADGRLRAGLRPRAAVRLAPGGPAALRPSRLHEPLPG